MVCRILSEYFSASWFPECDSSELKVLSLISQPFVESTRPLFVGRRRT